MRDDHPRILIVDDDEGIRELLGEVLRHLGYQVQSAPDGARAWLLLRLGEPSYDLVITDLNMPVMDGFELLRRIRRRSVPVEVILLTSAGGHEIATKARQLGACAVLSKPCDLKDLECAVESALARPASR